MFEVFKKISVEKIFLLIALFFGVLYVFILPPFQSVDEGMHFFRTYQIASGKFFAQNDNGKIGDYLPASLLTFYGKYTPIIRHIDKKTDLRMSLNNFKTPVNPENKVFTEFTNTALYSPICYISQLSGVVLGKMMKLSLGFIYYLGRLSNLIFYCILVYFALKITPFFKLPMFLLSLMPMSLSLGSAYTSDVMVLGLNFLWFALILKLLTSENLLKEKYFKNLVIMTILSFLISLTKSYILLIPLIFLIPIKKFKTIKQYMLFMSSVIGFVIIGFSLWYFLTRGLSLNMNNVFANSSAQKIFILTHPIQYIGILLKTFIVKMPRLYITMIGVLGWQDTPLDWITYMIYPALVGFAVYSDKFVFNLFNWQKYLIIITTIIGIILTYTSLYIMWSPVGNNVVLGLNGKYFIPMVLPVLLMFKPAKQNNLNYEKIKIIIILFAILILISSDLSLIHRFYNMTPQLYYKI